jgi:hypothetical protein
MMPKPIRGGSPGPQYRCKNIVVAQPTKSRPMINNTMDTLDHLGKGRVISETITTSNPKSASKSVSSPRLEGAIMRRMCGDTQVDLSVIHLGTSLGHTRTEPGPMTTRQRRTQESRARTSPPIAAQTIRGDGFPHATMTENAGSKATPSRGSQIKGKNSTPGPIGCRPNQTYRWHEKRSEGPNANRTQKHATPIIIARKLNRM